MVQKVWSVTRPFGDRIRQRLVAKNLSIRAWAEALGMTPSYCYQILNGHQHLSVERIIQTAKFLQMTTDDLLMRQEDLHIIVSVAPDESKEEVLRRIKDQLEVYFTERDVKG